MTAAARSLVDVELEQLVRSLAERGAEGRELVFVLGSGLGAFVERIDRARSIRYSDLPGMPTGGVAGHAGTLVLGEVAGVEVVALQGRVHLYEGRAPREVTRAVRALRRLGARAFVLTNAAGGVRPEWNAGVLMRIADHVNLQGRTPLLHDQRGAAEVWDRELGLALERGGRDAGVELACGVYCALPGPSYETPAEIRMLRRCGADAVGMSTALEALAARAEGARVCGVSLITNQAAGVSSSSLSHDEVVAAGRAAAGRFSSLLVAATPHLRRSLRDAN